MSIIRVLNQGKGAMSTAQLAIATTSHNVSNANTEGYSRQRVDMVTNDPAPISGHMIGSGVKVGSVTRSNNDFIARRLSEENTSLGKFQGMSEVLDQVEQVFQDEKGQGVADGLNSFFNSVRTLSTQPDSLSLRTAVRESARNLTSRFQGITNGLDQVYEDLNRRIEGAVLDVNHLTNKIATLNQQILEAEASGVNANDVRDSRDLAIQKLSGIIDVKVIPGEKGILNIMSGNAGVLVNGSENFNLLTQREDGTDTLPPSVMVKLESVVGSKHKDITNAFDEGSLGGFLQVRDRVVPEMLNRVNTLAYSLTQEVNQVHQNSFGLDSEIGRTFFNSIDKVDGAARNFAISENLDSDLETMAAGLRPGAPGDNRALLDLAELQDKKFLKRPLFFYRLHRQPYW